MKFKIAILIAFLFLCLTSFSQSKSIKERLLGTWIFEKFEYPNYIEPNDPTVKEANATNKGMTLTFTKDNKAISRQPNGRWENNQTTIYKLVERDTIIINGLKSHIDRLDEKYLVLYSEGRPVLTFKRKN